MKNKNYRASVENDRIGKGISFSVTHNGNHSTSIRIEDPLEEIPQMILALQTYLTGYIIGMLSKVRDKLVD